MMVANTSTMTLVETRLTQAKVRRQKAISNHEFLMNVKNKQAHMRAKQCLELKQDRLHSVNTTKIAQVQQRRCMLEQKRRRNVVAAIERAAAATQNARSCSPIEVRLFQAKKRRQMIEQKRRRNVAVAMERAAAAQQNKSPTSNPSRSGSPPIEVRLNQAKKRRQMLEQERRLAVAAVMERATTNQQTSSPERKAVIEARLSQAKERREMMEQERLSMVTTKRQKAIENRIHMQLIQQLKLQYQFSKVTQVKQRRTQLERKRRKRVMETTAHRFHSLALSRAERIAEKNEQRRTQVHAKRVRLEDERKSCLSEDIDRRMDVATRNLEERLKDVQCKAREDVVHATVITKKVKAARLLQSVVRRKLLNVPIGLNQPRLLSQTSAAIRLQKFWRIHVVIQRLMSPNNNKSLSSSTNALSSVLTSMGFTSNKQSDTTTSNQQQPFEKLAAEINKTSMLKSTQCFLQSFSPLFQYASYGKKKSTITGRVFLSAFLIAVHPDEVLEGKQTTDVCSKLLERISKRLIGSLQDFVYHCNNSVQEEDMDTFHHQSSVKDLLSILISYGTLFNIWKNSDLNELVSKMTDSAEQSWIVFLTSKEALLYGDSKIQTCSSSSSLSSSTSSSTETIMLMEGALYQSRLRHEMSKKGASKVVRRIRSSLNKLLSKDEGLELMKRAKDSALNKIKCGNLMKPFIDEVDNALQETVNIKSSSESSLKNKKDGKVKISSPPTTNDQKEAEEQNKDEEMIPNHLLSNNNNAEIVHKLLLTDSDDDVENLLITQSSSSSHYNKNEAFDSTDSFMEYWHQQRSTPPPSSKTTSTKITNLSSLYEITAKTMERAYYDTMENDLVTNKHWAGIREFIMKLIQRTRDLVPNRIDLHSLYDDDDVGKCKDVRDTMKLLIKISIFLSNDLEAPCRSHSTLEWRHSTETWLLKEEEESKRRCHNGDDEWKEEKRVVVPYEFSNPESYLIASVAFLLQKVELCHVDKMNYELIQVAPLLRRFGGNYEIRNFQEKYGISFEEGSTSTTTSSSSTTSTLLSTRLNGTWEWLLRSKQVLTNRTLRSCASPNSIYDVLKTDCFVDNLLFVSERIVIPEVLALDVDLLSKIREVAKSTVIGSVLLLHACNVSGIQTPQQCSSSLSSASSSKKKLMYRRDNIVKLLLNANPSVDLLSEELILFVEEIRQEPLETKKISSIQLITGRVCSGNDPVLKLLDGRMRQFFKFACKFGCGWNTMTTTTKVQTPRLMKTGLLLSSSSSSSTELTSRQCLNPVKTQFLTQGEKEAKKLGFGVFSDDLVKVALVANKAIHHCLCLYGENVLLPMVNQMTK